MRLFAVALLAGTAQALPVVEHGLQVLLQLGSSGSRDQRLPRRRLDAEGDPPPGARRAVQRDGALEEGDLRADGGAQAGREAALFLGRCWRPGTDEASTRTPLRRVLFRDG